MSCPQPHMTYGLLLAARAESRRALNSVPGFHSGQRSASATLYPTLYRLEQKKFITGQWVERYFRRPG